MLTRRRFFGVIAASVALPSVSARRQPSNEWGSSVFDLHFNQSVLRRMVFVSPVFTFRTNIRIGSGAARRRSIMLPLPG
jgi:hypothetical protein